MLHRVLSTGKPNSTSSSITFEVSIPYIPLLKESILICCLDEQEDSKDTLGAESAMGYLQSLGVGLEDASLFLAVELIQAPSIGEISRAGFVNGWKEAG